MTPPAFEASHLELRKFFIYNYCFFITNYLQTIYDNDEGATKTDGGERDG